MTYCCWKHDTSCWCSLDGPFIRVESALAYKGPGEKGTYRLIHQILCLHLKCQGTPPEREFHGRHELQSNQLQLHPEYILGRDPRNGWRRYGSLDKCAFVQMLRKGGEEENEEWDFPECPVSPECKEQALWPENTCGMRGRSQVRNTSSVLRTLPSWTSNIKREHARNRLRRTSSPNIRTHALIKVVRDESRRSGWDSNNSFRPRIASK